MEPGKLPLQDVRVLSLAINLPGPVATARLRDLGATTRKIEPPAGDYMALAQPEWYGQLHDRIAVERLDLKATGDRAKLDGYLSETDILVSANRPSALARLGLAPADLAANFPRLCHVAIVGYGSPREELPGHDLTYQAELGLVTPPALPKTLLADLAGAQEAVVAALALLRQREQSGKGGTWPVSLQAAAELFSLPLRYGLTAPGGGLGGALPGYNLYQTMRGWIAIAALEPHFLEKLRVELELAHPTHGELTRIFATRTALEWETWANQRGLPITGVRDLPADKENQR